MRAVLVVGLLAALCPAGAIAQTAPAAPQPAAAPSAPAASAARRGGDITRDEYIERAKRAAERRFDEMDADHNGTLTAEERRAWHEGHQRHRAATTKPPQ
jgi:hypothetical protein